MRRGRLCLACREHLSYTRSKLCVRCRKSRRRALDTARKRTSRRAARAPPPPPQPEPTTELAAEPSYDPEPEAGTVEGGVPEEIPEPAPPRAAPELGAWAAPAGFDPYSDRIPGFEGDLEWLRRTRLGLDGPMAELLRLRAQNADRRDRRVIEGLVRLKEAWTVYEDQFEAVAAHGPYGEQQAAIWRATVEGLLERV